MEEIKKFKEYSILDIWNLLWINKKISLIFLAVGLATSVAVGLLLPEKFTSTSVFLPVSSGGSGSTLSQYAGLAAMAGVSLPAGGDNTRKIQSFLESRRIRENVVEALNLVQAFEISVEPNRDPERRAVDNLEKMIKISQGKNGEISLSVEASSAELAQKIASQYVVQLESALNDSNLAMSLKEQKLNELQLSEQSKKLKTAQENLAAFQKRNRIIDPTSQLKSLSDLMSGLYSKKVELEVELKQLESIFNADDTRVIAVKSQILSLDQQIEDIQTKNSGVSGLGFQEAPEVLIEYQNLARELEIATKLYAGLLGSFAQNTLTSNKEKVFVEIIDPPLAPESRSFPNRTVIVALGTLSGLLLSIFFILMKEGIRSLKST